MDTDPVIELHNGILVVRDDLLKGGSKRVIVEHLLKKHIDKTEFVYASPVYGGFQIALATVCKDQGKKAVIVCAKHKTRKSPTIHCIDLGAEVIETNPGRLNVIQKRARDYVADHPQSIYIEFGGQDITAIMILSERVQRALKKLEKEPDEIWCACGSGTLALAILEATTTTIVHGVQVGKDVTITNPRFVKHIYQLPLHKPSKYHPPFPSNPYYDAKTYEELISLYHPYLDYDKTVLFWNVAS